MAASRNYSNLSGHFQMTNRSYQSQEAQDMELQSETQQFPFYPSPTQNYLPSYFQGSFHNPEMEVLKQMSTSVSNDAKALNASRNENPTYPTAIPTEAKVIAGPPKHGLGNLSSPVTSDPLTQELLLDCAKQQPGDWVTVFGFPPAATSLILTHFSECGSIEEKKTNPGSNWIHLKYASKIESRRALSKNGTILNATLMIGVVPYNSEGGHPNSSRMRYLGQQNVDVTAQVNVGHNNLHATIPTESQPSFLNKTFEYLFGW